MSQSNIDPEKQILYGASKPCDKVVPCPDPFFTVVHINSCHRKMAMGVSVVQAPTIESALQKLQIAASNQGETTEPLCAFAGRCENLLTLKNSSMRPTQAPSKQIEITKDLPKEPLL